MHRYRWIKIDREVDLQIDRCTRSTDTWIDRYAVQAAIKSTNEPPEGLKANLIRAWTMFNDEMFENSSKQAEFRSICFGLAFFHGTIIERKKFGPQGWNRVYPFNTGDLTSSAQVGATEHVPPACARTHTCARMCSRAHTHVFTRTRTCARAHARTHARVHACTHARTHARTCARARAAR